jgi:uncharacterized protein
MANPFVQVELVTQDLQKSRDFYGQLFDWKLEHVLMGPEPYTLIGVGKDSGGVGGLMMKSPVAGVPTFWLSYVLVDDVKASMEKAKSLGATVIRDVTEVPNTGWFSIIQDPQGAVLGLWKANRQQ